MMMKNPKKTAKVLYLYFTAPLLLAAAVLGVIVWMHSAPKKAERSAPAAKSWGDQPAKDSTPEMWGVSECSEKLDCGVGESCVDGRCVNLLVERRPAPRAEIAPAPEESRGTTEWAAIVAAFMAGLTGLLGAVSQTIAAFANAREKRRRQLP